MMIHEYEKRFASCKPRVMAKLNREDKEDVEKFINRLRADGISTARILKYLYIIKPVTGMLSKPLRKLDKEDMIELVGKIEGNTNISTSTKSDYKIFLKKYYKTMYGEDDEFPRIVKWIKSKGRVKGKLPEDILTEEEVKKLASNMNNTRDKAFILGLYESGTRIGEFLPLQLKHIEFDEYGAVVRVSGKTGDRRIRIIASVPAISEWIEHHPHKNNPESYLWRGLNTGDTEKPITYEMIGKILRRARKKAKIYKRVNPHAFRHARATHLANTLTESQMKENFGWKQSSSMVGTYVHLSGRDLDTAMLKMHGLKTNGNEYPKISIKKCLKCKEDNDPVAMFCKKCRYPIDAEERKKVRLELVYRLLKTIAENNPEIKREWQRLVRDENAETYFE